MDLRGDFADGEADVLRVRRKCQPVGGLPGDFALQADRSKPVKVKLLFRQRRKEFERERCRYIAYFKVRVEAEISRFE